MIITTFSANSQCENFNDYGIVTAPTTGTTITYISPAFPCSGLPAPGNTLCSAGSTVCPNAPINLTLQNPMLGSGITYQWYSFFLKEN